MAWDRNTHDPRIDIRALINQNKLNALGHINERTLLGKKTKGRLKLANDSNPYATFERPVRASATAATPTAGSTPKALLPPLTHSTTRLWTMADYN